MFRYLLTVTFLGIFSLNQLALANFDGKDDQETPPHPFLPKHTLPCGEESTSEDDLTSEIPHNIKRHKVEREAESLLDLSMEESSQHLTTPLPSTSLRPYSLQDARKPPSAHKKKQPITKSGGFYRKENAENIQSSEMPRPIFPLDDSPTLETLPSRQALSPQRSAVHSPRSQERTFWSPIRRGMFHLQYHSGERHDASPTSVREVYKVADSGSFFVRKKFQGKVVFQADQLFDPYALVLNKEGEWETNLTRMERGLCPIGHRGIASEEMRKHGSPEDIKKAQKDWRIEIQHVLQNNFGPLCEMSHQAHMGLNARFLGRADPEAETLEIIYSSLEIEEALCHMEKDSTLFMATNLLHFDFGPSKVDNRKPFRIAYWKWRAEQLKTPTAVTSTTKTSKIFDSPFKPKPAPRFLQTSSPVRFH